MNENDKNSRIKSKIRQELGPINALLADPAVIDIMYNPDGQLWVERFAQGKKLEDIDYPPQNADLLIRSIASYNNITVGPQESLPTASLPSGERFQGFVYPSVSSPAFSIRCCRSVNITLSDYVPDSMSQKTKNILHDALKNKLNIILSGGTGSGKTTFASALMDELYKIAPNDRIALMEETAEIQIKHKNVLIERKTKTADYTALLRANLRANPDRIILGEVRGAEAYDLLKSWNTGHPGGLTTLHANNAASALTRFESLILESESSHNLSIPAVRSYIAEAVNLVVQIERQSGKPPIITELLKVSNSLNPDATYQTENLIAKE